MGIISLHSAPYSVSYRASIIDEIKSVCNRTSGQLKYADPWIQIQVVKYQPSINMKWSCHEYRVALYV